jgi:bifunctional non-homologous end joining protein LigD
MRAMNRLEKYRSLRTQTEGVASTPEPMADSALTALESDAALTSAFVVHLHHAFGAGSHYDLRLEVDGVLVSFAIPKGPTLDPSLKHLAIQTEDHPLEYLDFEEVIPAGNYGAGPMIVWDRGRVRALGAPLRLQVGTEKLDFELHGFKLRGRFSLVKLRKEKDAYLLLKKVDAFSKEGDDVQIAQPHSVVTGLRVTDLENRESIQRALCTRIGEALLQPSRVKTEGGELIDPCFEGESVRVRKDSRTGEIQMFASSDAEVSALYPEIVRSLAYHALHAFEVFGTLVVTDAQGKPDEASLQHRLQLLSAFEENAALLEFPAQLLLHDVMSLEGFALQHVPYVHRRALLNQAFQGPGYVRALKPFHGLPPELLAFGAAHGITGFAGAASTSLAGSPRSFVKCEALAIAARASVPRAAMTNRSKMFFPACGIRKGELIDYYRAVSSRMLPWLKNRPVILTRYPDGIGKKSFFQWNVPPNKPDFLETYVVQTEGKEKRVFVVQDEESLVYVANLGCIPIHLLPYQTDAPERCDFLALDFDVKLSGLARAIPIMQTLRQLLGQAGLSSLVKTSGQTGLHVLIPMGANETLCKGLAEILGRMLVAKHPDDATMARLIGHRGDKVFVDVGQTGLSRAIAAPYAVRATDHATVSTPLDWDEVVTGLDPARFTLRTVLERPALGETFVRDIYANPPDLRAALAKLQLSP